MKVAGNFEANGKMKKEQFEQGISMKKQVFHKIEAENAKLAKFG